MAATIAHDFDLPMDRVAAGAEYAMRQLGYQYREMRAGTSTHTIDFDIPGQVPSHYVLEIRQIVPNASRVFVTGSIPQLCQKTLDCIETTLKQ